MRHQQVRSPLSAVLALAVIAPCLSAQTTNSSSPVGPYGLDNVACQQNFYTISVNSTNTKFQGLDQTQLNQSEATALVLLFTSAQSNFTEMYTGGTFQLTDTFNISGTLCTPVNGAKNDSALQLLVHGVAFDSSYWDFGVSTRSFIDASLRVSITQPFRSTNQNIRMFAMPLVTGIQPFPTIVLVVA